MDKTFKNFKLEIDPQNVAWLAIDKADASANVLSSEVLLELDGALAHIESQKPSALVIYSAKKSGFIAGADVNEFTKATDEASALAIIRRGQEVFTRIDKMPFPTVALIHGFCLGGGMELALACRYRVASTDEKTQMGLPEVKLGIHPGFGGTVRSTRVMGGISGLEMMLTGRNFSAKAAKKAGLVDLTVPDRHLKAAALSLIKKNAPPHKAGGMQAIAGLPLLRGITAKVMRKKTAEKADPGQYPSPFALIDLWERYGGDERRMMEEEARSVSRLIVGDTAQNLVRLFQLQDRLKGFAKKSAQPVKRLHVVGAGAMGGDIAAWSALRGLTVTLQDRETKFIAPAIKRAAALFNKKLKDPRLAQLALDRLIPDPSGAGAASADIVIEAVFEDLKVKRELFARLEPMMKPGAVLASNTSSIPLEEIAATLARPERLVGIHFFNPVPQMPLVEVVRGAGTGAAALEAAFAYVGAIGKLPVPVKSSPGFLVNRVLMPYLMEAMMMEAEGIAPAVIDAAAVRFGMPMGPLLLGDTVGLDICYHVGKVFKEKLGAEIPPKLESMVKEGKLGVKSGQGYYDHRGGKVRTAAGPATPEMKEVTDRLMLRYVNECVACLREGIVADADLLDAGMVFGSGFAPFRGGPLRYARAAGKAALAARLEELRVKYGPRFAPDAGWSAL